MPQPGPHGAVYDDSEGVDGVEAEGHRDQGRGVVEGRLDGVHVGTRESSGVVRLVVEGVHLEVLKIT